MRLSLVFAVCFSFLFGNFVISLKYELSSVIQRICLEGDLEEGYYELSNVIEQSGKEFEIELKAKIYHTLSELALILYSDFQLAMEFHNKGKEFIRVMPPLPELHLQGKKCGGLGDLYYVSAVTIKQLIDANQDDPTKFNPKDWLESLTTLITLTSDSGLAEAAENHYRHASRILLQFSPEGSQSASPLLSAVYEEYYPAIQFRSALLTPGVYSTKRHLGTTRKRLLYRIQSLYEECSVSVSSHQKQLMLKNLDEFVLAPTFYFIYFGSNDRKLLTLLQSSYQLAMPALIQTTPPLVLPPLDSSISTVGKEKKRLKIGFVSNYFRKHSICKLFCQVILALQQTNEHDLFIFSTLQDNHHDDYTNQLIRLSREMEQKDGKEGVSPSFRFISVGKPLLGNRYEVLERKIDILVNGFFFFCDYFSKLSFNRFFSISFD
jgi:hypothetical protein